MANPLTTPKSRLTQHKVIGSAISEVEVDFKGWKVAYVASNASTVVNFHPILTFSDSDEEESATSLDELTIPENDIIVADLPKMARTNVKFDSPFTGILIFFLIDGDSA
jgi:hypothetical protein